MKVFFLGLPGSGKTTLGKEMAKLLGIPFIDLDAIVEHSAGMPIREIFKIHQEQFFRQLEANELKRWCLTDSDFVMATGGGTPCFFDNMTIINRSGKSVFIDVPSRTIVGRILKTDLSSRPLFAEVHPDNLKDKIEFLRSQRMVFYRQAHLTIGSEVGGPELLKLLRMEDPR